MKDILQKGGGIGILVLFPLLPFIGIYLVYLAMKVGRGYWSAGTTKQKREIAGRILANPNASPLEQYVAEQMLNQES